LRYKVIVVNLIGMDGKDRLTKLKLGKPPEDKSKVYQPKKNKSK
jgi:hypothetical protein